MAEAVFTLAPIEQCLINYLTEATGEYVSNRVPRNRPKQFVVLNRMGGGRRNLVQSDPTIFIQIWGSGTVDQSEGQVEVNPWPLTKKVWESLAMIDMVGELPFGVEVMKATIAEPVDAPDEATRTPRYTIIFTPTVNL